MQQSNNHRNDGTVHAQFTHIHAPARTSRCACHAQHAPRTHHARTAHAPYMHAHAPHAHNTDMRVLTRTSFCACHARHEHSLCTVGWSRRRLGVILPLLRKYLTYRVPMHSHTPGRASAVGLRNFYSSWRRRHCAAQHGVYYSYPWMIYYWFTLLISIQEFFRHMYRYFRPDGGSAGPPEPPGKIKHEIRLDSPPVKEEEKDARMYMYDSKGA